MKIIGLLLTWNNFEFFKCALEQALDFCDEVLLVEGCHSIHFPARSNDGTCDYIKALNHPKLKAFHVRERIYQYDKTQLELRKEIPKKSQYWEPGNWLFYFDDDRFFLKQDLAKIKEKIQTIESPHFSFKSRYFFYNFRFNQLCEGGNFGYKILEDMDFRGISYPCYPDGRKFDCFHMSDVTEFHYSYVKKPERMKARWDMSVEKGTVASATLYDQWMDIKWEGEKDIYKQREKMFEIRPEGKFNIYRGSHPAVLDNHPWRHVEDIRRLGV